MMKPALMMLGLTSVAASTRTVVSFEKDASLEKRQEHMRMVKLNKQNVKEISIGTMHAYITDLDDGELGALQNMRGLGVVRHVEDAATPYKAAVVEDGIHGNDSCLAQNVPSALYNLDRVDQVGLPLDGRWSFIDGVGANADIYIVDSGIRITHNEFNGVRARWLTNTIDNDDSDGSGHGTHVAGIAAGFTYGLCKACNVIAVKVLDARGSGTLESILAGLDQTASDIERSAGRKSVVNLSLGGAPSDTFDDALTAIHEMGAHVVAAAGNDNWDACTQSPSRAEVAITVANSMLLGSTTDFRTGGTNWGPCVDLWAPGNNILSADSLSDSASLVEGGTSMSSPLVAAVLAMHASLNPTASVEEIQGRMLSDATKDAVGDALEDRGTPNLLLHMACTGASSASQ